MHLDVQDLRNFYYRSALGRAAQMSMRDQMLKLWPEAKGQTVVGFGFATPFIDIWIGWPSFRNQGVFNIELGPVFASQQAALF